jgi:hypothetical protein
MRVLWRFKYLVAVGSLLAVVLAGLTVVKVSFANGKPSFAYRQAELWAAQETLLITERGFPEGRTIFPLTGTGSDATSAFADPNRLAGLAVFYSQLANSDIVLSRVPGLPPRLRPLVTAAAVTSSIGNQSALPLLAIAGRWITPQGAIRLTEAASSAFQSYIEEQQATAGIPTKQRVILTVVDKPDRALVAQPRKKTIPILVFLAVMGATFGLALILEHMRPRVPAAESTVTMPRDLGPQRVHQPAVLEVGRADANR